MKGIILAGGRATRLYPASMVVSKQLLPVYDKPMIYYPLSVLMLAKIREILIISTPSDLPKFKSLLKDGSQWGLDLSYCQQPKPEGIAQAFLIGSEFIAEDNVCLILGDNIFYGHGLPNYLDNAIKRQNGATVFGYWVNDPQRYGVISFDDSGMVYDIEEKPQSPKSNWAVTGLYFYDNQVVDIAAGLKPSGRGELEITDVNKAYLAQGNMYIEKLGRGIAWLDTGTHASLMQAANYIEIIEQRQGLKISCLEEIAYRMGYIDAAKLEQLTKPLTNSSYGEYLLNILDYEGKN